MAKNNIDILDEALRVMYLQNSTNDGPAQKNLATILSINYSLEMPEEKKAKLLSQLKSLSVAPTLGQVLQEKLKELNIQPDQLASTTSLPVRVMQDLLEDKIYTNNVPIVFFKNLLKKLNVSFAQAEKSIRKTFELLQSHTLAVESSSFHPAYRKGLFTEREVSLPAISHRSDGKELYENKEALDNYLTRLEELLN